MDQRRVRFFLMTLVAVATTACGSGARSAVLSTVPSASTSAVPSATGGIASDALVADLPTPKCPASSREVVPPFVSASSGNGQVVAATSGSYTTMTCSTTGNSDAVPRSPTESLATYPGDTIRFTVPVGWHFSRWEGSHEPLHGTGAGDKWPPTDVSDGSRSIALPDGPLLQDELINLTVVLVSDDERAVIELGLQLEVNRNVS